MAQPRGWMAFGNYVRTERQARGMTQEDLAERVSEHLGRPMGQNKVSKNERGKEWRIELVQPYVSALELDIQKAVAMVLGDAAERRAAKLPSMNDYLRLRDDLDNHARGVVLSVYNEVVIATQSRRRK